MTGGEVVRARRLEPGKNVRWEIHVRPDSNAAVTIVLPATTDCEAEGAICTGDGRPLSERVELTVSGPNGLSPQAAFLEFAKLLFVKLWENRRLRDDPQLLALISQGEPIRRDLVRFSLCWVAEQEANDPNPVASILFRQLVESLEREIADRRRKRIFQPDERLDLAPGTVKRVVSLLEGYYLFGIDEDLNGRMFEAFLTATMRGQALGQYFTPRSVVKLMTRLARPVAQLGGVERVLDACCGTGGFLIEALTDMRAQVYSNTSLTTTERNQLLEEIENEAIFGIDAGREPPITRIARINMYLHGDGGSRIYMTDGLRHVPRLHRRDGPARFSSQGGCPGLLRGYDHLERGRWNVAQSVLVDVDALDDVVVLGAVHDLVLRVLGLVQR